MKRTLFIAAALGCMIPQAFAWNTDNRTIANTEYLTSTKGTLDATAITDTTFGIVRAGNNGAADTTLTELDVKNGDTAIIYQNPWELVDFNGTTGLTIENLKVADSGTVALDVRSTNKVVIDAIDGSFSSITTAATATLTLNGAATVTTVTDNGFLVVNDTLTLADGGTFTVTTLNASNYEQNVQTESGYTSGTYTLYTGTGSISGLTTSNVSLAGATASSIDGNKATLTSKTYRIMNGDTVNYDSGMTGAVVDSNSTLNLVGAFSQNCANLKTFLSGVSGSGNIILGGTIGGPIPFTEMANTGCNITLSGAKGWVTANSTVSVDLTLENRDNIAGLDINGANSNSTYTFSGKISGTGNMAYSQTDGRDASFILTGDLTDWTGNFTNANTSSKVNLQFKDNANTTINNTVNNVATAGTFTVSYANDSKLTVTGNINNTSSGVINLELKANTAADFTGTVTDGTLVTLNSGTTISFLDGATERTVTLGGMTVNGNTTVNANVVMTSGTITIADGATVTMGSTLNLSDSVKVVLSDAVIAQLDNNEHVTLFTSVDDATLNGTVWVYNTAGTKTTHALAYDAANQTVYATPEPATATLSLLALAGLCARRRRRA